MSKTLPSGLAAVYASGAATLAIGLRLQRADGLVLGFTSADREATIGGVVYSPMRAVSASSIISSDGLAVDNLEMRTVDWEDTFDLADIIAGRWNGSRFALFRYSWADPSAGIDPLQAGVVGQMRRERGVLVTELRCLKQYLQQPVGSVTSKTCRARFADFPAPNGNNRCRLSAVDWTDALGVTEVIDRRRFRVAALPGGDPSYYANAFLLHLDGAMASTAIVDTGPHSRIWTAAGNAAITTVQSRFGGASLQLDGAGDWVWTAQTAECAFGAGPFSVEAMVNTTDANFVLMDAYAASLPNCWQLYVNAAGRPEWWSATGSAGVRVIEGSVAVNTGAWRHVAVGRDSAGTLHVTVDAANAGTVADARVYVAPNTVAIGAQVVQRNAAYDMVGYVDEVRVKSGASIFDGAVTVPSAAFADYGPSAARADGWYAEGVITWGAGGNAGLQAKVKSFSAGVMELCQDMPRDIHVGDLLAAVAGCRRRLVEDCRARFDNVVNFAGEPHLPGLDAMISRPGAGG